MMIMCHCTVINKYHLFFIIFASSTGILRLCRLVCASNFACTLWWTATVVCTRQWLPFTVKFNGFGFGLVSVCRQISHQNNSHFHKRIWFYFHKIIDAFFISFPNSKYHFRIISGPISCPQSHFRHELCPFNPAKPLLRYSSDRTC